MLSASGLSKRFGRVWAVRGASFTIRRRTITAFLGENGAGKTTSIRMLLGFLKPDAGRIVGEARRVGYIPENPAFFPWLRGRDVLAMTALSRDLEPGRLWENLPALCSLCRFEPALLERSPYHLSAGNRKKFSWLQSLVVGPDLLIADEPFSALDPPSVRAARDLLAELKSWGVTVLLSSHMLAEVEKICDEFILIQGGRVALQDDLGKYTSPSSRGTGMDLEKIFQGRPCPDDIRLRFRPG